MNKFHSNTIKRFKFLCLKISLVIIALIQEYLILNNSRLFNNINLSAYKLMKGISNKLKNHISPIKNQYKNFLKDIKVYNHTYKKNDIIFWCWLQGLNFAPLLYKTTLNSIYKHCGKYKIVIIDENNLQKYIKLPSYIYGKYKSKIISKAHFCDLIRLELLIKYGGTWIDSSVLITRFNKIYFEQDLFFFSNLFNNSIAGSNWFITSEIGSPVLKTTRDLLYEYWRRSNYLINYFIFHIFFTISFDLYKEDYKNMINYSFVPVHYLYTQLLKNFDKQKYNYIIKSSDIHKLTIKKGKGNKNSFIRNIIKEYEIV